MAGLDPAKAIPEPRFSAGFRASNRAILPPAIPDNPGRSTGSAGTAPPDLDPECRAVYCASPLPTDGLARAIEQSRLGASLYRSGFD